MPYLTYVGMLIENDKYDEIELYNVDVAWDFKAHDWHNKYLCKEYCIVSPIEK